MSHAIRIMHVEGRSDRAVSVPGPAFARRKSVFSRSEKRRRRGFTLIELLITILIIGILSGLFFGALQRAGAVSKVVHTKSTVAKLNVSLMDRWDSYRSRRLPLDPKFIFTSATIQGSNARNFASQLWVQRGSQANDPLNLQPGNALGITYPSNLQIAATRLACMRELMCYEMPQGFGDLLDVSSSPGPGGWPLRSPALLLVAPPIALTYATQVNRAYVVLLQLGDSPAEAEARIRANDSAECLYMILTIGSTDSGLFGEQLPTADVGDIDGDGLLEFQDAWSAMLTTHTPHAQLPNSPVNFPWWAQGKRNSPINFLRWAPGFISSLQDDPFPIKIGDPIGSTAAQVQAASIEFCLSHHDYFDPLKLDVADISGAAGAGIPHAAFDPSNLSPGLAAPCAPRGFALAPLIYSGGPDGVGGIDQRSAVVPWPDPYYAAVGWAGWQTQDAFDNITNHELDTRSGK